MGVSGVDSLDHVNDSAVYGTLTVGTTAVEVKVGGSALAFRKLVTMQADDNKIYWGYDSSVTTSTGTRIYKGQYVPLQVGPDIPVYVIADGAGKEMRIGELA